MKLQIKDAGAWRDISRFNQPQECEIMDAAARLLKALDAPRTTMRIEDGGKALAYCEAPSFAWRVA